MTTITTTIRQMAVTAAPMRVGASLVQIPRRAFLSRLAGVLAAGSAGALAAAPAVAAEPPERPELVALGLEAEALHAEWRAARERRNAARAAAEAASPPLPPELVLQHKDRVAFAGCSEREQSVEGRLVYPEPVRGPDGEVVIGMPPPREILQAELMRRQLAPRGLISRRSKAGRRIAALIDVAGRYEAEREAAISKAGSIVAWGEFCDAIDRLEDLAPRAEKIQPTTLAGLLVYARIFDAIGEAEISRYDGGARAGIASIRMAQPMASAVLRLVAKAGATS